MKRKILFVIGLPMLMISQAFACEADHTALMRSIIAKSSSPANVREVSLHQKAMYCEQNAINLRLQGDKKTGYLASCMNKNEANERQASFRRQDI